MIIRYVRLNRFEELTGYTPKAIECKIADGAWMEGREYRRAPDGHILVDLRGYEEWVEHQNQGVSTKRAAKSGSTSGTAASG